jgi:hypothetical protein
MRKIATILGIGALLCVGGLPVASVASGSGQVVVDIPAANAVEQTVEQADNAYVAVFSPMLSSESQVQSASGVIGAVESEFTDNLGDPIGTPTLEADSMAGSTGGSTGVSDAANSGWSEPSADLASISPSSLAARNETVVDAVFAPTLAAQILSAATNINNEEATLWKTGLSSCSAQDCTITGAAGAVVTAFDSETIGTKTATVETTETVWQDDGEISSPTGTFTWFRSEGTFTSIDQLQLSASGEWQVASHSLTPNGGNDS